MNMKTMRLARGGKCVGFGASGFSTPARACSRPSVAWKARKPKPPVVRCSRARRVRGWRKVGDMRSAQVDEFIRRIQRLAEQRPRALGLVPRLLEKRERVALLVRCGRAAVKHRIHA